MNFHQVLTSRILESGSHEAWIPHWGSGAAVLRYYPHFPHLLAAGVARVFSFTPYVAVVLLNASFLALLPLAIWWSMRFTNFSRAASAASATLSIFLEADVEQRLLLGMQIRCFTWEGWGLMGQLVGIVFALFAWKGAYEWIVHARGMWLAAVLLATTWLSHMVLGYGLSVVSVVLVLTTRFSPSSAARWIGLNVITLFFVSYFIAPMLLESHILNKSLFEPPEYWNSFGLHKALLWLWQGKLLGTGGSLWFTRLVLISMAWCAVKFLAWYVLGISLRRRKHSDAHIYVSALALIASFLLFSGRSTFGPVLQYVPLTHNLPFHRFFILFHMFSLVMASWLAGEVYAWVTDCLQLLPVSKNGARGIVCSLVAVGLLFASGPLEKQAHNVAIDLAVQRDDMHSWWGQGVIELLREVGSLVQMKPGRAYGGARWNWGQNFDIKYMKIYALWTQLGLSVPNIGFMWHTLGLNSDLDFFFDETRPDHHALYNIRYIISSARTPVQPFEVVSKEIVGHAVHEWTGTKGYFSFIRVVNCFDAWIASKEAFWKYRESFVKGILHYAGAHPRTALIESEKCNVNDLFNASMPNGRILGQTGNTDDFVAMIECNDPAGCTVMLRVTYHPNFVVYKGTKGETLKFFSVAPSFLAFVVPQGLDTYRVVWSTPTWSTLLFWICYISMAAALFAPLLSHVVTSLKRSSPAPKEKKE